MTWEHHQARVSIYLRAYGLCQMRYILVVEHNIRKILFFVPEFLGEIW